MIRKSLLALALMAVCTPALSQDIEAMNPKELQGAAAAAVVAEDADLLLEIMQEMQRREMLFFKEDRAAICDREPAKTGYFETAHPFHHGAAKQWYFMKLREIRLAEQSCECLAAAASFDDLLQEQFSVTTETMTEEVFFAMRDERESNRRAIDENYRAFHSANCRGE